MGLQDFNTNRDHAVGEVKSRKNIKNLTLSKEGWTSFISLAGGNFPIEEIGMSEEEDGAFTNEELKAVIKLYDQQIDEEQFFGYEEESEEASHIKNIREDLVDILKERKS